MITTTRMSQSYAALCSRSVLVLPNFPKIALVWTTTKVQCLTADSNACAAAISIPANAVPISSPIFTSPLRVWRTAGASHDMASAVLRFLRWRNSGWERTRPRSVKGKEGVHREGAISIQTELCGFVGDMWYKTESTTPYWIIWWSQNISLWLEPDSGLDRCSRGLHLDE